MNRAALLLTLSLLALPSAPALAEEPKVTRTTTVFGDDPCPAAASAGEIIVCGRLPERERYRIPKQFRKKPREDTGPGVAWGAKVQDLESAQRFTMPGSCTAVGFGGQSGCTAAMLHQWFLERQQAGRTRP